MSTTCIVVIGLASIMLTSLTPIMFYLWTSEAMSTTCIVVIGLAPIMFPSLPLSSQCKRGSQLDF